MPIASDLAARRLLQVQTDSAQFSAAITTSPKPIS